MYDCDGDLQGNEFHQAIYALSEPAGEEEPNTIDLKVQIISIKFVDGKNEDVNDNIYFQVTPEMTPDDVVQKILELSQ